MNVWKLSYSGLASYNMAILSANIKSNQ